MESPPCVSWSAGWGGDEGLVRYLRTCGTRDRESQEWSDLVVFLGSG